MLARQLPVSHLKPILRAENSGGGGGFVCCEFDWRYWMDLMLFPDQEDRTRSVNQFRNREKDVLVATDVASKGLDFPDIQHVINYDMPEDIENYGRLTRQKCLTV